MFDTGVMARGHVVGAEAARALEQRRELEVAVAVGAGQGRASAGVLANEVRDDLLFELLLEVHDVVRDADGRGDASSVGEIIERAAAAEPQPAAPSR